MEIEHEEQYHEKQVEKAQRVADDTHRVEVLVAINGHHAKDRVVVAKSHPFYNGLIDQNLARVIG